MKPWKNERQFDFRRRIVRTPDATPPFDPNEDIALSVKSQSKSHFWPVIVRWQSYRRLAMSDRENVLFSQLS
jgi:hypothetical protein